MAFSQFQKSIYIPAELIDQIRASNDIVDCISEYVTLKKRGKSYLGLCPFHTEKTPSFSVNPETQTFHCFGCHVGGDLFRFLMDHEQISFYEAVKLLARRAQIALPRTSTPSRERTEADRLFAINEFAAKHYHHRLCHSPQAEEARNYLRQRGLSQTTTEQFQLGFALAGWDDLIKAADHQGISVQWLQRAGLVASGQAGAYDYFRNRILFPIFNVTGRVVGFGGRALQDDQHPKYLNSQETPLYRKSRLLYGISHSREKIRRTGEVILVEGYMDYLSLFQADIENVVATCGTALTKDQAALLSRYTDRVILLYDGDVAGIRAAIRGSDVLVEGGLWPRIVILPEGQDPDSLLREEGPSALMACLEGAQEYLDFKLSRLPLHTNADKQHALNMILDIIGRLRRQQQRALYLQGLAERFNLPIDTLIRTLRNRRKKPTSQNATREPEPDENHNLVPTRRPEWGLVQLMLRQRDITVWIQEYIAPADFEDEICRKTAGLLFRFCSQQGVSWPLGILNQNSDPKVEQLVAHLLALEDTTDTKSKTKQAIDFVRRIKTSRIKTEFDHVKQTIQQMEQAGDHGSPDLLAQLQRLNKLKQAMQNPL